MAVMPDVLERAADGIIAATIGGPKVRQQDVIDTLFLNLSNEGLNNDINFNDPGSTFSIISDVICKPITFCSLKLLEIYIFSIVKFKIIVLIAD